MKDTKRTKGYSIWLMPRERDARGLQKIVNDISSDHHTFGFPIHLTLLGQIEKDESVMCYYAETIVNQSQPISVKLGEIKASSDHFRSIYIEVTAPEPLLRMQKQIRLFTGDERDFTPHISLAYGLDTDKGAKIIPNLVIPRELMLSTVQLQITEGLADKWKPIMVLKLRGMKGN